MKVFILILMILPFYAQAHCPISLKIDGQNYCTQVNWLEGEQKLQGQLLPTNVLSPALIAQGQIPQQWVYSKASLKIWAEGDRTHSPITPRIIPTFRVFPYMIMENGHHHSASYNFVWNPQTQSYEINGLALQAMDGCWSLRWTTTHTEDVNQSELLSNITQYNNLSEQENLQMQDFCAILTVDPHTQGHRDHNQRQQHHHHNHD